MSMVHRHGFSWQGFYVAGAIAFLMVTGCTPMSTSNSSSSNSQPAQSEQANPAASTPPSSPSPTSTSGLPSAMVTAVEATGEPGAYTLSVTVQSPDTGCDQYADWWEVMAEDGTLIHRRVLLHSHVTEQPFTRSSGPVELQPDQPIIVRAHLSTTGYGTQAMGGTIAGGFEEISLPEGFAAQLAEQEPLPQGCEF